MVTEEQEKRLERFIELLADLSRETSEMLKSGDLGLLYEMNDTVEEMYSIQNGSEEKIYKGIDEPAKEIYKNFNDLVTLAQKCEEKEWSEEDSASAYQFLENIFEANREIIFAYGLAE